MTSPTCVSSSCHEGTNKLPIDFLLSDYSGKEKELYRNVLDRVNLTDPENSLLLRKGAGQGPHGGGNALSNNYNTVLNWIRRGAPCGTDPTYC